MSDAVRITHYKVIGEALKKRVSNPAALAALRLNHRSEPDLIFEPSGERLFSRDWRPVGLIRMG